jgi:membrane associated rhomboid family serine protease
MVPALLFGDAELPSGIDRVPPWATLFTCMFLHGGWLHILGNMLYLWIFGKGVESALGGPRYLLLYLICGVAAALTQAVVDPSSEVPMIGASGAIAGILGAYLLLHPRGNVVIFFWLFIFVRFIAVPAVVLLGLWFLLQLTSALSASAGEPGVAVWAHVGGFITGLILLPLFRRRGVALRQPPRTAPFSVSRTRSLPPPRSGRGPWG